MLASGRAIVSRFLIVESVCQFFFFVKKDLETNHDQSATPTKQEHKKENQSKHAKLSRFYVLFCRLRMPQLIRTQNNERGWKLSFYSIFVQKLIPSLTTLSRMTILGDLSNILVFLPRIVKLGCCLFSAVPSEVVLMTIPTLNDLLMDYFRRTVQ